MLQSCGDLQERRPMTVRAGGTKKVEGQDTTVQYHVVEHSELLANPLFWAAYYLHDIDLAMQDEERADNFIERIWGVSLEEVLRLHNEFLTVIPPERGSPEVWTGIEVPLPDAFFLQVVWPDDVQYRLGRSSWSDTVLLGYEGGCYSLPALRWKEVILVDRCLELSSQNDAHRRMGVPLFFPTTWIGSGDEALMVRERLIGCWRSFGLVREQYAEEFVDLVLASHRFDTTWRHDPTLGWVNDSQYSRRNPVANEREVETGSFGRIREFVDMLETHR
jgi:hypothetical protein